MILERVQRGAGRRAALRWALGRPGSLRRWIAGSVIWFGVCGLAAIMLRSPLILLAAALVDISAFIARRLLVGDEDEFNPALTRSMAHAARHGVEPLEDEVRMDPADWLSSRPNTFFDVPPPPVADAEPGSGQSD